MTTNITQLNHGGSKPNRPDTVVIHSMAEFIFDGENKDHAVKFLDKIGLSAHSLVAPDGTIYRCRMDEQRAWHARGHNANTLGIEFLVPGEHDYGSFLNRIKTPYVADDQYAAGIEQVLQWCGKWPIRRIVRHSDIDPGRKLDPGAGFPWAQFIEDVGL